MKTKHLIPAFLCACTCAMMLSCEKAALVGSPAATSLKIEDSYGKMQTYGDMRTLELTVGDFYDGVIASVTPSTAKFTWTSSDPFVVEVAVKDNNAWLKAAGIGEAWIKVQSGKLVDSVLVTVTDVESSGESSSIDPYYDPYGF